MNATERIDRAVNMLVVGIVAVAIASCLLSVAVEKVGTAVEGVVRAARCTEVRR